MPGYPSRVLSRLAPRWPTRRSRAARGGILILGHSHVQCLQRALDPEGQPGIEIHDLNQSSGLMPAKPGRLRTTRLQIPSPDAVYLCLGGNYHNQFGLIEHPRKFACGLRDGTMPDMTGRQPVPHALIRAQFKAHLTGLRGVYDAIYAAFPSARFTHFNPPPPIGDWDHILANPGIFGKFLKQGPMPPALRLEFYTIQTDALREIAEEYGAAFLTPPRELGDDAGFLAPDYFNNDPTHGNTAYGRAMLRHILDHAGAAA